MKATKDAQRRLREHAEMAYSYRSLIPDTDIQFIIEHSETIKVFVNTTVRSQSRRSRQRTLSVERSQSSRHQDPSPDGRLVRRVPDNPRTPPLSGGTARRPERQTTDSASIHLVDRPMDSPLTSRRSSGSQDAQGIIDITRSPQEDTGVSASVWDASSVFPESQSRRKQKIVGPRICDDGQHLRVCDGEWPSEISESSQISTDPHNRVVDTVPPLPGSALEQKTNAGDQIIEQESQHQGPRHGTDDPVISTDNGPIMEESTHISKHSGGSSLHST